MGRLCFAPNLPQAQGVDWNDLIGDQLPGRRLLIENDANFAVLAEHRLGAARGHDHVVMVTLGTGIGGGLMIDGRVQVGAAGFAGEIGHMVVDPNGPPCPCGRRGCWERFASGAGLGVRAREAALAGRLGEVVRIAGGDPESVRGEDVSAAAAAGDPAAQRVIRDVGWWIGFGLANLTAVLDPGCFVLGGGVIQAGDLLLDSARATFAELVEGGDRRPAIVIARGRFRGAGRRGGRGTGGACGRVVMRTGVVLPTFRDRPEEAFAAAAEAVEAGVDGVFCYDHVWPLGQPERPALAPFPILGALATLLGPSRGEGEGPYLGTLVARVGLVPNAVLVAQFVALDGVAPGRVIAGLGTGDKMSEEENRAYGIPFPPAAERRAAMIELGRELSSEGIAVWVAGGPAGRTQEAQAAGAALTVWDAAPELVAERAGDPAPWRSPGPARRPRPRRRSPNGSGRWGRPAPAGSSSAGPSTSRNWPTSHTASVGTGGPAPRDPGPRLPRWSSAASTGCRRTSSPPSTTSRRRRGEAGATSSTSGSGIPTCPRPTWLSPSWPRPPRTRATTVTPPHAAFPSCAAPSRTSTSASSTSRSTPRPRWSRPSGPRRASRT